MKNIRLIIISLSVCLAIIGCGANQETKSNSTNSQDTTMENKNENTEVKQSENAASTLSPDSVDVGKPIPAADLQTAVKVNQEAWKGKEVAIIGKVLNPAVTTDAKTGKKTYALRIAKPNSFSIVAMCMEVEKEPPADYKTNPEDRVIKGTIEEMSSIGETVKLKNCDYVK